MWLAKEVLLFKDCQLRFDGFIRIWRDHSAPLMKLKNLSSDTLFSFSLPSINHLISSRRCRCFGKALLLLQGPLNSFSKTNRGTARQSRSTTLNWSSNLLHLRCAALGFFCKGFSLLLRVELSTPAMELVTILALGLALIVDLEIWISPPKCCSQENVVR